MEERTHNKFYLIQRCKTLDNLFKKINRLKSSDFKEDVIKKHYLKEIDTEIKTTLVYDYKYHQLDKVIYYKRKRISWGATSRLAIGLLIDNIRRDYNYDDPYKHKGYRK